MPDDRTRTERALAEYLLTRLPVGEAYRRSDFDRLPLPVAHYLGGVLDRRIAREAVLPESDWFDATAAPVREAARAWQTAVREAAHVPAETWETTIRTAARQLLAYLADPVDTLADWVFADGPDDLPLERVRARMAAFPPYAYLREIAENYLDSKGVEAVHRPEFERLLRRIDRRMVADYDAGDWLLLLDPLFDLVGTLPEHDGRVPTALLQRFFEAKGLDDLAHDLDGPDTYDPGDLRDRLADLLPDLGGHDLRAPAPPVAPIPEPEDEPILDEDESDAVPNAEDDLDAMDDEDLAFEDEPEADIVDEPEDEPAVEVELEPIDAPESDEPELVEDEPVAEEDVVEPEPAASKPEPPAFAPTPQTAEPAEPNEPLWKRLARERGTVIEEPAEIAPAPSLVPLPEPTPEPPAPAAPVVPTPLAVEPDTDDEPLWKRFTGETDAEDDTEPVRLPGRRETLTQLETRVLGQYGTERRDWYKEHLTGGDEARYTELLRRLDIAEDWTAAVDILGAHYRHERVPIYSDAAVAFTDNVEMRYRS